MSVRWRFFDASGSPSGDSGEFGDREEAEAWIAGEWEHLLERGVEEVALAVDGEGDLLYRMSLRAEA